MDTPKHITKNKETLASPPLLFNMKKVAITKALKILLKIGNVLVILMAIGILGYYLGYKKIETKLLQKGFNIAVGQIIQSVQQNGEVKISQDLILIKKP